MARKMARLPTRFPVGTKYVVEARGSMQGMTLMHRYVEFPDGRRMELAARMVPASGVSKAAAKRAAASLENRQRAGRRAAATASA